MRKSNQQIFPIAQVKGNRLISIDGNHSSFYKITGLDLEQLNSSEKDQIYDEIAINLNNIDPSGYMKFYRLGNASYLDSNLETLPSFSAMTFKKQFDPLQVFFQDADLYSDIGIYDDYLSYNGQYVRIFSAIGFSEDQIAFDFIPRHLDYVVILRRSEKEKTIKKLERIRSGHLASFMKNKRDLASEGTYEQAEGLLFDLLHGLEALFDMELYFILRAYSLFELKQKTDEFYSLMLSRGIKCFVEGQSLRQRKAGLATLFNELIPGVRPILKWRSNPNKTGHLRYLLPFSESHIHDDGVAFHDQMMRYTLTLLVMIPKIEICW